MTTCAWSCCVARAMISAPATTWPKWVTSMAMAAPTNTAASAVPASARAGRKTENRPNADTAVTVGRSQPAKEVGKRDVEGVFVVGADNKVSFRTVKVGIAGERHFEVLEGLKAGETIVAGTYQAIRELKDGALIKTAKPEEKTPAPGKKS